MTLKPDFLVLKTLTQLPGIAGRESAVREYLQKLLAPAADEVRTDALGNLICFKKGTSDKNLLLCAQSDVQAMLDLTYFCAQKGIKF